MQLLALLALLPAAALAAPSMEVEARGVKEPKYFTSGFSTRAVPGEVIANSGVPTPGQPGTFGHFSYQVNSDLNIICYDIRTVGVNGTYMSPARTATHIHQAAKGAAGPPRIAFPNPEFVRKDSAGAEIRRSRGCLKAPFVTGLKGPDNTTDTGSASGFTLRALEANPGAFFTDTHTAAFPAGAVRGQLQAAEFEVRRPKSFDAKLTIKATPDQVIASAPVAGVPVPGQAGATGIWKLDINVKENTLCYWIKLQGVTGYPFSPAKSATHLHQAARGAAGPPRIAFKNPVPAGGLAKFLNSKTKCRYSSACVKGPFTTGLLDAAGADTGSSGFTLQNLIDNPSAFFIDSHTEQFGQGALRGQLA